MLHARASRPRTPAACSRRAGCSCTACAACRGNLHCGSARTTRAASATLLPLTVLRASCSSSPTSTSYKAADAAAGGVRVKPARRADPPAPALPNLCSGLLLCLPACPEHPDSCEWVLGSYCPRSAPFKFPSPAVRGRPRCGDPGNRPPTQTRALNQTPHPFADSLICHARQESVCRSWK